MDGRVATPDPTRPQDAPGWRDGWAYGYSAGVCDSARRLCQHCANGTDYLHQDADGETWRHSVTGEVCRASVLWAMMLKEWR